MSDTPAPGTAAGTPAPGTIPTPELPRRSRLRFLLILGVVVIVLALGIRMNPWVREYPYRTASLATLREWAKGSPRDPLLYYYLGTKAYNAQSLGEAGFCFQNAVNLDPKLTRAFVGLALVQRDVGQFTEAYGNAKQAQERAPRDVDIQFLVATLVMEASRSRAIPEFEKVTRMAPRRAEAWYLLGTCQQEINQVGEAIGALRKAVTLEPKVAIYQRELGKAQLQMNQFAEARATLETAIGLDAQDPVTHYLLGETWLKTAQSDADLQKADGYFQEYVKIQGRPDGSTAATFAAAHAKRAEIARRMRQPKQALTLIKTAQQVAPNELRFLYDEAEVLRALGDEARARALMAEYTRRTTDREAARQMTERVKQDPKNPDLRLRLARLFAKSGDLPRAINQYEYCLYLEPLQVEARRELDALKKQAPRPGNEPRK